MEPRNIEIHLDRAGVFVSILSQNGSSTLAAKPKKISAREAGALRKLSTQVLLLRRNAELYCICFSDEMSSVPIQTELSHLCPSCRHCSALAGSFGCQKVRDLGTEKRIEKYRFIVDGHEVINGDQASQTFIVNRCANYHRDSKESRKEETRRIIDFLLSERRLRRDIDESMTYPVHLETQ